MYTNVTRKMAIAAALPTAMTPLARPVASLKLLATRLVVAALTGVVARSS